MIRRQFWNQTMLQPVIKNIGIGVAFEAQRRDQFLAEQSRYHADSARFLALYVTNYLCSTRCSGILTKQRIFDAALVNIHNLSGIDRCDLSLKFCPLFFVALGVQRGFFYALSHID